MAAGSFLTLDNMQAVIRRLESELESDVATSDVKIVVFDVMREFEQDAETTPLDVLNDAVVSCAKNLLTPEPSSSRIEGGGLTADAVAPPQTDGAQQAPPVQPSAANSLPPVPGALADPATSTVYASVDGASRDVLAHPQRYRFTCSEALDLRNVTEVATPMVMIPVPPKDFVDVRRPCTCPLSVPYVVLVIDQLCGEYAEGSSDVLRRGLCRLYLDRIQGFPGGRSYAVMKPVMGEVKKFRSPLPAVGRLTVSLRTPSGALLSDAVDTHVVDGVFLNTDAAGNWVLRTREYWTDDFASGDIVTLTGSDTGFPRLDRFLDRAEGHVVLAVGEPAGQFFKTLVVSRPYDVDPSKGCVVEDDALAADLAAFEASGKDVGARALNLSVQISVSLKVTCQQSTRHAVVQ